MLASKFSLKDLGKLTYFLGISVVQNQEEFTTRMGQPAYVKRVLEKQNVSDCKQVGTPTDPGSHLLQANETEEAVEQCQYPSLVGSLMDLSVCTRPDIAYAVSCLACSLASQTRVIGQQPNVFCVIFWLWHNIYKVWVWRMCWFSDADWAGDQQDRRSTSGYLFQMAGGPISLKSRKQGCLALSTAEAKYMAFS